MSIHPFSSASTDAEAVPPALEVESLSVWYGRIQAVWDVSITVQPGKVTCLLGSNGAGKTTFIHGMFGLQTPRTGQIHVGGKNFSRKAIHKFARSGVALVPEGRRVFSHLSVRENLRMGTVPTGSGWRDEDRITEALELFPELEPTLQKPAGALSGGQQQMVAIGRALTGRPWLLVLDEPSMGLAPVLVERIGEALNKLRERGHTVLLAEQNIALGADIADEAFLLESGEVVATGPAHELTRSDRLRDSYLGS